MGYGEEDLSVVSFQSVSKGTYLSEEHWYCTSHIPVVCDPAILSLKPSLGLQMLFIIFID